MKAIFLISLLGFGSSAFSQTFEPNWESLHQYVAPAWYRDAKFGIFMHWGVQSVPAHENGWYARQMYMQHGAEWGTTYKYHTAHYGHPSEFGYKDLIPLWRAEKWDPDSLVRFYRSIGAKYIVPVAVHHDNFDNYASTFQPWNSVNMGPHRDIVGEWKRAAGKYGLRFGVSSHSDRSWDWFSTSHGSDGTGEKHGVPYDGNLTKEEGKGLWWEGYDPQDLYSRPHQCTEPPDTAYCEKWFSRTKELIDKYQPDLLWFDGPMPMICPSDGCKKARAWMEHYGLEIASHFYNSSQRWHQGRLDAVLNIKSWEPGSVPDSGAIVLDIEKGQTNTILPHPWQTDTSIPENWYFDSGKPELSDTVIIHNLCDIVSKNGNLLLNVGLRSDGTLPDDQRSILLNVGKWLDLNGEAIYGTRPWKISGEGKTGVQGGDFKQNKTPLTSEDIRFTTKGNTLYAIALGWPHNGTITVRSLAKAERLWFGNIRKVELVGVQAKLQWEQNEEGLTIHTPEVPPCRYAYVFRISGAN